MSGPYTVNLDSFSLDALPPEHELPASIQSGSARRDSPTKPQSSVSAVLDEMEAAPMLRSQERRYSKKAVDRSVHGITLDDLSLHERRLKEHVDQAFARQEELLHILLAQKTGFAQLQAPSQAAAIRDVMAQCPARRGSDTAGDFSRTLSPKAALPARENSTASATSRRSSRSATAPAIIQKDARSKSFGKIPTIKDLVKEKGSVRKMEEQEQSKRDQALEFSRSVMEHRRLSRKMSEVTHLGNARKRLHRFTSSTEFEVVMVGAIFANAIMLGVECNYFAVKRTHDVPDAFFAIGIFFTVLFALELLLRLAGEGFSFFHNSNWMWNYLDFVIVVSSLLELTVDVMRIWSDNSDGEVSGASGLASMRILRLVRITRLMRIFRISKLIRLIKALQTLVYSILCTLKSLVWAMLLLILLIYVFGIILTQATTDFLVDTVPEDETNWHIVNLYWGNLGASMFTLFKCISNGVSWDLVVEPLGEISVSLLIIFNMFIVFAYFSVLNVVTGVFCQSAIDAAQHDKDMVIQNHVMHRERYTIKAQNLFSKIKESSSRPSHNAEFITLTEFEDALTNEEVQAFFDALEVDATDAWALFKLIDTDCTHRVSIEDFIDGCIRVKGTAKSLDMIRLIQDQQTLRLQLMHFKDNTEVRLLWIMKIFIEVFSLDASELSDLIFSNSHSHDCS